MNLTCYELFCIIIPLTIISFTIDFLSDGQITKNELKLGCLQFLHHLVSHCTALCGIFFLFITNSLIFYTICITLFLILQVGFLINNDYCWLTKLVNTTINKNNPLRKWMGSGWEYYIKHYIRGGTYAYSKMNRPGIDNKNIVILNIAIIIALIKQQFVF
jgi:hypothetical protein